MNKKIGLGILASLLLFVSPTRGQQIEEKIEINFGLDECVVEPTIGTNQQRLQTLNDLLDQSISITSIAIESYASPEGDSYYNQQLSERRAENIYQYLISELAIASSQITVKAHGVAWERLGEMVEASNMKHKTEVLKVIRTVPVETWRKILPTDKWMSLVDSRNKHLMDLQGGRPYRYMQKNFFPALRSGTIVTIYFKRQAEPILSEDITIKERAISRIEVGNQLQTPEYQTAESASEHKPIRFALKTNLLYDALLTPNIELEIPIGNRWSAAGEWIFPWWVTSNNGYALQILSGQVEGRYWLGDRTNHAQLTGWFAGLYAGGGLYDLQWRNNGYQGEFYIAAGVSAGYAHAINKRGNLRMEYSLGLGYLSTEYRYYEGKQNNEYLVWQHDGRYTWLGPTKAKASLVWYFDWKRGGKR